MHQLDIFHRNRQFQTLISTVGRLAWSLTSKSERGATLYIISSGMKTFAQMMTGLVIARMVQPVDLGIWQSVSLLLPYLHFLSLGIPLAVKRQYAVLRGQGDDDLRELNARVALTYTALWSLVSAVVVIAMLGYYLAKGADIQLLIAIILFFPVAVTSPFQETAGMFFRSSEEFGALGKLHFVEALWWIVSVGLVWRWGWSGLYVRYATIALLSVALLVYFSPQKIAFQWDRSVARSLLRLGSTRFVVAHIYLLFVVADRTLIAAFLGAEALGFYALAGIAQKALLTLPNALNQVIQARMMFRFGETNNVRKLKRITFLPVLINMVILFMPTVIAIVLIDPFARYFLPQYVSGIRAAQLILVCGYLQTLRSSEGIFTTTDRMREYGFLMAITLVLMYILGWGAVEIFSTIEAVAMAKLIITAFLVFFTNIMAYRLIDSGDKKLISLCDKAKNYTHTKSDKLNV